MRTFLPSVFVLCLALAGCGGTNTANSTPTPAPAEPAATTSTAPVAPETEEKPRVFFVAPKDGAEVTSPVHVEMGVEGVKVHPAGEVIEGTGHHHLIIDGSYVPEGQVVPSDATHLHFGKGQTQTDVKLSKGEHTLTLQFANGKHESFGKSLSATIHITVTGDEGAVSAK